MDKFICSSKCKTLNEIHLVNTAFLPLQGNYSIKVESVVRKILEIMKVDPDGKILVFSTVCYLFIFHNVKSSYQFFLFSTFTYISIIARVKDPTSLKF